MQRFYGTKGEYLGFLQEDGNNIRAFNNKGQHTGYYNKNNNTTYDKSGMRLSSGNTVVTTIYNNK